MNSFVLCLTVVTAVRCGYVSDLGLSPDELDFTPKDHKADDYDFTPEEYKETRRGDHGGGGHDDHKPPTSYSHFKLVSKNAVPIKVKVPKPAPEWKPKKPEWQPKKPMWKPASPPAEWKPSPPAEWKPSPPAQWKPSPPAQWKPSPPAEWKPKKPEWKPKKPEWPQPPMSWSPEPEEEEEEEPVLNTHPFPSPAPPAHDPWKSSPPSGNHGWQSD